MAGFLIVIIIYFVREEEIKSMFAIKYLIQCSCESLKSPEEILRVSPAQATGKDFVKFLKHISLDAAYEDAMRHMPQVIQFLVRMKGFDCAGLAARLYELKDRRELDESALQEIERRKITAAATPRINWLDNIEGMHELKLLWDFGISLSWAIFNWGEPERRNPYKLDALPLDEQLSGYMHAMRDTQGSDYFDKTWWIGPIMDCTQIHICVLRMLSTLPKITVFPEMPPFSQFYERTLQVIRDTDLDDPGYQRIIAVLRKKTQATSLLFFANPAMVHRWRNGVDPRLIMRRYCFLIMRVLEMYGNQAGLMYWLKALDQVAKIFTHENFYAVIENGRWSKKGIDVKWRSEHMRGRMLSRRNSGEKPQDGKMIAPETASPNSDSGSSPME